MLLLLQIEKKCDQMRKLLRKADKEYCELCEKAETARQEWEFNVAKVSLKGQGQSHKSRSVTCMAFRED